LREFESNFPERKGIGVRFQKGRHDLRLRREGGVRGKKKGNPNVTQRRGRGESLMEKKEERKKKSVVSSKGVYILIQAEEAGEASFALRGEGRCKQGEKMREIRQEGERKMVPVSQYVKNHIHACLKGRGGGKKPRATGEGRRPAPTIGRRACSELTKKRQTSKGRVMTETPLKG